VNTASTPEVFWRARITVTVARTSDPTRSGAVVYMYVSDADALHAEWSRAGVPGRLGDPDDREYGLREFGYVDPDGTLHRVGSPLTTG